MDEVRFMIDTAARGNQDDLASRLGAVIYKQSTVLTGNSVYQIAGQEDAMYQATVTVTTKGRKDDLPVKSGDIISIIRTTKCPQGKWLARDSSNTCECSQPRALLVSVCSPQGRMKPETHDTEK